MKTWPTDEYIKRALPRPPWVVEGLIPAYGITLIYAFPKVGKSILSIQLAHALGTNTFFLNHKPDHQFKVLYVQSDLPEGEWQTQLEKVGLIGTWETRWIEPGWLYNPKVVDDLKQTVQASSFDYLIYDALVSISGYVDLDDIVTMGRCITVLRQVSDQPCAVIHHKRKGSPGVPDHMSVSAAGSYALSAGVSTLFDLTDSALRVRGRFVSEELNLGRDPKTGQWTAKTKQDLYRLS